MRWFIYPGGKKYTMARETKQNRVAHGKHQKIDIPKYLYINFPRNVAKEFDLMCNECS